MDSSLPPSPTFLSSAEMESAYTPSTISESPIAQNPTSILEKGPVMNGVFLFQTVDHFVDWAQELVIQFGALQPFFIYTANSFFTLDTKSSVPHEYNGALEFDRGSDLRTTTVLFDSHDLAYCHVDVHGLISCVIFDLGISIFFPLKVKRSPQMLEFWFTCSREIILHGIYFIGYPIQLRFFIGSNFIFVYDTGTTSVSLNVLLGLIVSNGFLVQRWFLIGLTNCSIFDHGPTIIISRYTCYGFHSFIIFCNTLYTLELGCVETKTLSLHLIDFIQKMIRIVLCGDTFAARSIHLNISVFVMNPLSWLKFFTTFLSPILVFDPGLPMRTWCLSDIGAYNHLSC